MLLSDLSTRNFLKASALKSFKTVWTAFLSQADLVIKWAGLITVYIYRLVLSPILGGACRYSPSCSEYAIEAFHTHSAPEAISLTIKRILRCRPGASFGYDPVPQKSCECRGHV